MPIVLCVSPACRYSAADTLLVTKTFVDNLKYISAININPASTFTVGAH